MSGFTTQVCAHRDCKPTANKRQLFQFLQRIRSISALESAVQFIPGALSGIAAAISTARMLRSITPAWLMVPACFAFFAGSLLLATAPVEQSYWHNIFWSFVIEAWR